MLSAYVNASDMNRAEKFFRRLKEDGLRPNVVVYGTLMKGYARDNNLEKVMRVYERMQMQGIEANQTIFTTIMDAHGKNSDFGNSVLWFKEMGARGFPPDQKAKNILLSLAKTTEEKEEANKLVGNPTRDRSEHQVSYITEFVSFIQNKDIDGVRNASLMQNVADLCGETTSKFFDLDVDDDSEDDSNELDSLSVEGSQYIAC